MLYSIIVLFETHGDSHTVFETYRYFGTVKCIKTYSALDSSLKKQQST